MVALNILHKTHLLAAFLMISGLALNCQIQTLDLLNSGSQKWKGSLYVFGLNTKGAQQEIVCYKLNKEALVTDSARLAAGKNEPDRYLRLWADTLHGFLNIYLQKKGEKEVSITRLDKSTEIIDMVKNVEVARLNNRAMLGPAPFYHGRYVYSLFTVGDSTGKQFFLNRYSLKEPRGNFDYQQDWQYAFERKNIHTSRVIYAGNNYVNLFTEVAKGPKKGQWILTLNAENGELIRGSKLNEKGEEQRYLFGACLADTLNKKMYLLGEKVAEKAAAVVGSHSIYLIETDSMGQVAGRHTFSLPVKEPKRGASKTAPQFKLVFEKLEKTARGLQAETDIYIKEDKGDCYNYCNTTTLKINVAGDQAVMEKNELRSNRLIEDWLYLNDKARMNGRMCADSSGEENVVYHSALPFPVKKAYKNGKEGMGWLLQKTETGKGQISFGRVGADKNVLKIFPLGTFRKLQAPKVYALTASTFVLLSENKEGKIELQPGSW